MSEIYIDLKEVRNINHSISLAASKISVEKKKLGMLRWTIPGEIMDQKDIRNRLDAEIKRLERAELALNEIHRVTAAAVSMYTKNEEKLTDSAAFIK